MNALYFYVPLFSYINDGAGKKRLEALLFFYCSEADDIVKHEKTSGRIDIIFSIDIDKNIAKSVCAVVYSNMSPNGMAAWEEYFL